MYMYVHTYYKHYVRMEIHIIINTMLWQRRGEILYNWKVLLKHDMYMLSTYIHQHQNHHEIL